MDESPRQPSFRRAEKRRANAALAVGTLGFAIFAATIGCRSNPYDEAYVQTLHSEIRMLEDEIFAIESEYDKTLRMLDACDSKVTTSDRTDALPSPRSNPLRDLPRIIQPERTERVSPSSERGSPAPELLPPALHGESVSGASRTKPKSVPRVVMPEAEDGEGLSIDLGEIEPQSYEEPVELPADARVTHIVLNPRLTGGCDFNGAPGDDGLYVVVEPRNQDDAFVPLAGEMSLVLLDPREEAETARVARWDLAKDEVERRIKLEEATQPGIHLKLPWNALPPSHEDLLLFVRYVAEDGRNVEVQSALTIAVSGKASSRWTPRSPEAQDKLEHPVPPSLPTMAPAAVPTVQDLRKRDPGVAWAPPKIAPASASEDAPPAKIAPKSPAWKPYR